LGAKATVLISAEVQQLQQYTLHRAGRASAGVDVTTSCRYWLPVRRRVGYRYKVACLVHRSL